MTKIIIEKADIKTQMYGKKGEEMVEMVFRILHLKNVRVRGFFHYIYSMIVWCGVWWAVGNAVFDVFRRLLKTQSSPWYWLAFVIGLISAYGASSAINEILDNRFNKKHNTNI